MVGAQLQPQDAARLTRAIQHGRRRECGAKRRAGGRAFELAVGAELLQQPGQVFYWRERKDEVDYVYQYRDALYAIEVKSGRKKSPKGLTAKRSICRRRDR